jgi:hypothetical protein
MKLAKLSCGWIYGGEGYYLAKIITHKKLDSIQN